MNRIFPMLEYLETIGLKYLIRPSDPLRLTEMHTTSLTDTPLHFCDSLHLPSGCFLWKEFQSLHRLTAVQKFVGCCPKQPSNSIPRKVEELANKLDNSMSAGSPAILCQTFGLYFKLLFSSTSTSEKEFRT